MSKVPVIFIQDGKDPNDSSTKTIKLDICKYIKKYYIEPPKFIQVIPLSVIKMQRKFYKRGFLELLDKISNALVTKEDL